MRHPRLLGSVLLATAALPAQDRIAAEESAAAATLRNLVAGQAQCQAMGVIDVDGDGTGEYAYFAELAGAVPIRGADGRKPGQRINPPIFSRTFGRLESSTVVRAGYCYALFLPDAKGRPLAEAPTGGAGTPPDPSRAARMWCGYAWPRDHGKSGRRAFFVDQNGDLFATENTARRYSGVRRRPGPLAAYPAGTSTLGGAPDFKVPAGDGQKWSFYATLPARSGSSGSSGVLARLMKGGKRNGESSAIAVLRNIHSAQAQFQAARAVDVDGDDNGEYGFLAELAGAVPVRTADDSGKPVKPPFLTRVFGKIQSSVATRRGYCFQVFLPGATGQPLPEGLNGGAGAEAPDPAHAEHLFFVYAWPLEYGATGKRAFFINHNGEVRVCENDRNKYSGLDRRPPPFAAFPPGAAKMTGAPVTDRKGSDGGTWFDPDRPSPR